MIAIKETIFRNAITEEEPWDSPFQWHSSDLMELPKINAPSTLPELPYNRDPLQEIPQLPPTPEPSTTTLEETMNVRNRLLSESNSVVDKDFEFIKAPVVLKKRQIPEDVNPVEELKRLGRRESEKLDEDEPPFNFQKMLRKTNFQRESLRREKIVITNGVAENMMNGSESPEELFSGEILPGVFLEGIVIAL